MNKVYAELVDKKIPFKIVTDYNLISNFNTETNILSLNLVADLNISTKLIWSVESISDNFTFSFIHKNSETDVTKGYGTINKIKIDLEANYITPEVSFYLLIKLSDKASDDYLLNYKITLLLTPKISLISNQSNLLLSSGVSSSTNILRWRIGNFRTFVQSIFNIGNLSDKITSNLSNFRLEKIIKQFSIRGDVDSITNFIQSVQLSFKSSLEGFTVESITSDLIDLLINLKDIAITNNSNSIETNITNYYLGFMSKPEGVVNCLNIVDENLFDKCYKIYNTNYNSISIIDSYKLWYTINQQNLNLNTNNPILDLANLSDNNSIASLRLDSENIYISRVDTSLTYVNKSFTKEFDIKIDSDRLTGTYIIYETILLESHNSNNNIAGPFTILYRIGITNGRVFVLIGKTTPITTTSYGSSLDNVSGWNQKLLGTTVLNSNSFYHIAFCNVSGTLKLFVNGNEEASSLVVGNSINDSRPMFSILGGGFSSDSNIKVKGYLDYYRFNYGSSLYNTNFTLNQIPDKGTILI